MFRFPHVATPILAKIIVSAGLALVVVAGAGFAPAPTLYYGADGRETSLNSPEQTWRTQTALLPCFLTNR
jgi:hypothetical protein